MKKGNISTTVRKVLKAIFKPKNSSNKEYRRSSQPNWMYRNDG